MKLEATIDFAKLGWVKRELDESLARARRSLGRYVDAPESHDLVRACIDELHQVHGTLHMLELYAVGAVVAEMEQLVGTLPDVEPGRVEDTCMAVIRGMLQIPDYLERVQSGCRTAPVVLLPLLNGLRACRGAGELSEQDLFSPGLDVALPASVPGAAQILTAADHKTRVVDLRRHFQQELLSWLRGRGDREALERMRGLLDELAACCHGLAGRRLWWIAGGVLDGLSHGALDESDVAIKRLVGRVDRYIHAFAGGGEAALDECDCIDLQRRLLYAVAHAGPGSDRVDELCAVFRLERWRLAGAELEHSRGAMAGRNRQLFETVVLSIKNDLLDVKDALDLYTRGQRDDPTRLAEQAGVLNRVGDTLDILGWNAPRRIIGEQAGIVRNLAGEPGPADAAALLGVATALLHVEALLDDYIDRFGIGDDGEGDGSPVQPTLTHGEKRHVLVALMREAAANITTVQDMLTGFVESSWDHSRLSGAGAYLQEVSGALRMVDAGRPADLIHGIASFIHNELVVAKRIPRPGDMDRLADALSSVEYHLEACGERRAGTDAMLGSTQHTLQELGYWPVPAWRADDITAVVATPGASLDDALRQPDHTATPEEAAATVSALHDASPAASTPLAATATADEDMPATPVDGVVAPATVAGFRAAGGDIDDDIREIFLDEVRDEIESITHALGAWERAPDDMDQVTIIRRSFHTLKGSGRLVGADALGEFSWKIEDMLNRVLDGSIPAHASVRTLVRQATDGLRSLLGALEGTRHPDPALAAIAEAADRLAAGEMETTVDTAVASAAGPGEPSDLAGEREEGELVAQQEDAEGDDVAMGAPASISDGDGASVDDDTGSTDDAAITMDPALLEVLQAEVAQHLASIRADLALAPGRDLPIQEPLLRAVHTLHGAISMVNIAPLGELLAPLENWLKRLRGLGEPMPAARTDTLREVADVVDAVVTSLGTANVALPDTRELTARIEGWCDELPPLQTAYSAYTDGVGPESVHAMPPALAGSMDINAWQDAPDAVLPDEFAHGDGMVSGIPDIESSRPPHDAHGPIPDDATRAVTTSDLLGPLSANYHFPNQVQADGKLDVSAVEPVLLEVFIEESRDLLDSADAAMAAIRSQPKSLQPLQEVRRDLHTLKGGAHTVMLSPIGHLAHAIETLLEALDDGTVALNADIVESIERGLDYLLAMVNRAAHGQALQRPDQVIAHFAALAQHDGDMSVAESVDAGADDAAVHAVDTPAARPELLPEPSTGAHEVQDFIRVRADVIDSLVNNAGEVSIYRARLEQQFNGLHYNLTEFDQTVVRLRGQLRKLEIETEAQIIARYQREQEERQDFDPLELDRFSQLQQYSRALAESVADLVSLQGMLEETTRQSEALLVQQARVNSQLQEGLMRTRMVPFDSVVPSLRRILRQVGQETGKHARLRISGTHGEMDRDLLERLKAPFEHMLRNALVHGIESPAARRAAGKSEEGTVGIDLSRDATEVVIRVSDDGAGLDSDAIRARAIERGLLDKDADPADADLFDFILDSGLSTASEVTQLAGRGIGMDVVANQIKQIGGSLRIESQRGRGTTFTLRVPFTLALTRAVLVKVGDTSFAIPMTSVQGLTRFKPAGDNPAEVGPGDRFTYAGEDYPVHDLADLLGIPAGQTVQGQGQPLLLARSGDAHAAVRVDAVLGAREIVVKPVGPQISSVQGIFGATIMGDGSVVLIIDVAPLIRRGRVSTSTDAAPVGDAAMVPTLATPRATAARTIMVVDDSITMRKVTARILERNEFDVITAKDGVDALERLHERVPDLVVLDIEMPLMDGYEVAEYMRNDPRLANVPIIMVTSRSGGKHRQRAVDIGVQRYMGKPYQEADLLAGIGELLGANT